MPLAWVVVGGFLSCSAREEHHGRRCSRRVVSSKRGHMEDVQRIPCRHCHHRKHEDDCSLCGCVRYEALDLAAREERKRLWLVEASFLVRRGWTRSVEVRVKSLGLSGAAMRGTREARRASLKPRTRVQQVKLTIIAVPKGGR